MPDRQAGGAKKTGERRAERDPAPDRGGDPRWTTLLPATRSRPSTLTDEPGLRSDEWDDLGRKVFLALAGKPEAAVTSEGAFAQERLIAAGHLLRVAVATVAPAPDAPDTQPPSVSPTWAQDAECRPARRRFGRPRTRRR